MKPTWRKPVGVLALLAALAVYVLVVARALEAIAGLPSLAQAVVYLAAGTAWLLPLRPLLVWMETGRWR